jgi:NitT/TauT family transport system ATP-binding protein
VAQAMLATVGLRDAADKRPHELSGGMRQRVAVARALAMRPKMLLMDEPFAALDVQTRAKMQDFLVDVWRESAASVLFVTHDIDEAVALADRVMVLTARPGRIKATIPVDLPPATPSTRAARTSASSSARCCRRRLIVPSRSRNLMLSADRLIGLVGAQGLEPWTR